MITVAQLISTHQKQFAKIGFFIVVAFIAGFMSLAALADVILAFRGRPTIGDHVNGFVRTHPWIAALIGLGFGALISHLILHINDG